MASFATACRASVRLASSRASTRGLSTSTRCLAAQNFIMPALSPTMTEGNIASWRVKEGQRFSAGDVLLEIETDKATMDVEAQDDGIMMKITSQDGSKAVPVGTRIAVLAEADDDISTLEIPADEQPKSLAASSTQSETPSSGSKSESKSARPQKKPAAGSKSYDQKYPLMPSVGHLIKSHGINEADVGKIKPTGPNGRLLKGDVLAYLGNINADTPAAISSRFDHLAHLDLSNIKVAESKAHPTSASKKEAAATSAPAKELPLEVSMPVSLANVTQLQKKLQDTLGVSVTLSTFVDRAAKMASDKLPRARHAPTADELFDAVVGLDKVKTKATATGSGAAYMPVVSAICADAVGKVKASAGPSRATKRDIIDELASRPTKTVSRNRMTSVEMAGLSSSANLFTLKVPKAEEERAYVFLQRCKSILESEPGRLIL